MATNELPENAIELDTAVTWVDAWRKEDPNTQVLPLKGFLVPKVDFTEALAEGAAAIRTYIGIDPTDEDPQTKYHILVVAVDDDGNDMLNPDLGQYVYDFSHPCPPTCSGNGRLK